MLRESTTHTVAKYAKFVDTGEIVINKEYQRNSNIWSDASKSFFVETMLLNLPIPKLYLVEKTVTKPAMKTVTEIVDGQQRTEAILQFLKGEFKLQKNIDTREWRGKRFQDLPDEVQQVFAEYSVPFERLTGAEPRDIFEIFRRINSHSASANPEEVRHAQFQGEFKWFAYHQARDFQPLLQRLGIFGIKQLARMQDVRFMVELVFAFDDGIKTTKAEQLTAIYQRYDDEFPKEGEFKKYIAYAMGQLAKLDEDLADGNLMKPYIISALCLALIHQKFVLRAFVGEYTFKKKKLDIRRLSTRLSAVSSRIEDDGATADRTTAAAAVVLREAAGSNVADNRRARFLALAKLLEVSSS
jgi:hypothetical protein